MLTIEIPGMDFYDEEKEQFITTKPKKVQLEHSLVSLAKWESKWNKPFLDYKEKTAEETLDYIECMIVSPTLDRETIANLPESILIQIKEYIDRKMTATTVNHQQKTGARKIITAELIYYWMVALNIPFECQKWHLDRLLTLIDVCSVENAPKQKMSGRETRDYHRAINASRRKQHPRR